jgi:hypothetical protein
MNDYLYKEFLESIMKHYDPTENANRKQNIPLLIPKDKKWQANQHDTQLQLSAPPRG